MKFEIKSRWTGAVIFTADIDCDDGASHGIQLGLAVKVAVKARADLARADLVCANLANANMANADLAGADLAGADLAYAYLVCANLANANMAHADLAGADLAHANLAHANLNGITGLNDWIKCIQIEDWPITYTAEVMQIGCQRHPLDAWRNFSDAEIRAMDGRKALTFWHKWRETIFKIIEMAPAQPTKAADPVETESAE